jgi:hypothetical protein
MKGELTASPWRRRLLLIELQQRMVMLFRDLTPTLMRVKCPLSEEQICSTILCSVMACFTP